MVTIPPLPWVLFLSAALFCVGLYAVLARRNGVILLMGVVLMLNAALINLIAFWRHVEIETASGQVFALAVVFVTLAEALTGLGLLVALWRSHGVVLLNEANALGEREGA